MVNASFLKRREIAVHFPQTSKRSKNHSKLPKSIKKWLMVRSFVAKLIHRQHAVQKQG